MPSAALIAARKRHARAMVAACPGTVVLGGVTYTEVAVGVQPGILENTDGGQRSGNILTVSISKEVLETAPARLAVLTYAGQNWVIEEVAGTEPWAKEWIIKAYQ
jgi:hypothetical protein